MSDQPKISEVEVREARENYREKMGLDKDAFKEDPKTAEEKAKKARSRALDRAHEIRKFEIGLYWQRALFFWGFQAVFFIALGNILGGEKLPSAFITQILTPLLCILGFLTANGLVLMNEGSKAWHANWECHIDMLEDEFEGKLHKTHLFKEGNKFPSVSKVNSITSKFLRMFWFFSIIITVLSIPDAILTPGVISILDVFNDFIKPQLVFTCFVISTIIIIITVFAACLMRNLTKSNNEKDNEPPITQRKTIPKPPTP